jgi:hypothetical protein
MLASALICRWQGGRCSLDWLIHIKRFSVPPSSSAEWRLASPCSDRGASLRLTFQPRRHPNARVLRVELLSAEYLANVALVFAAAPLAIWAFSAAKQAIPFVHPFSWDARIATLGSVMHGGTPMWALLQPVLGYPRVTVAMHWSYHRFWTALMLDTFLFGTLLPPSPLRRQYLLAVVLLFLIVGTLGALAFASAGPAYYERIVGAVSHPYALLFEYLRTVDLRGGLLSVRGEQTLWFVYTHQIEGFGLGVSAMPSMHVASGTLTAPFGFVIEQRLGVVFTLIAVGTWIGSAESWMALLVGWICRSGLACSIWWLAGRLTKTSTRGMVRTVLRG